MGFPENASPSRDLERTTLAAESINFSFTEKTLDLQGVSEKRVAEW